jgi:nitrate/nitrite transport system ATP-binding protein
MVTHDVDEAILLSDKIALMSDGPEARLAEMIEIEIPRPRSRETLIENPDFTRIRKHVLNFLVERSRRGQTEERISAALSPVGSQFPGTEVAS